MHLMTYLTWLRKYWSDKSNYDFGETSVLNTNAVNRFFHGYVAGSIY
jgi:hypothetical protein